MSTYRNHRLRLCRNLALLCLAFNQLACGLGSTTNNTSTTQPINVDSPTNNSTNNGESTCSHSCTIEDDGHVTDSTNCNGIITDTVEILGAIPDNCHFASDATTTPSETTTSTDLSQ